MNADRNDAAASVRSLTRLWTAAFIITVLGGAAIGVVFLLDPDRSSAWSTPVLLVICGVSLLAGLVNAAFGLGSDWRRMRRGFGAGCKQEGGSQ